MGTEFWIQLRGNEYNSNIGWSCPALSLPSARLVHVVTGGETKTADNFVVNGSTIRYRVTPNEMRDGAALISIDKSLVTVSLTAWVTVIGALIGAGATISAAYINSNGHRPEKTVASIAADPVAEKEPAALPTPTVHGDPSLLTAFKSAKTREFAGAGTVSPPSCSLEGGVMVVEVAHGYDQYAGCYLELSHAADLTGFVNTGIRIGLREPTRRLEIKLEGGPAGQERIQAYVFDGSAAAGEREYRVPSDLSPAVLKRARRLTVAVSDQKATANRITMRP